MDCMLHRFRGTPDFPVEWCDDLTPATQRIAMQISTSAAKRPLQKRIDWDGAWKEAIQQFFPAFLALLFPEEHRLIDWMHEPVFLEQELRHVTRRAKRGKGAVDKLVRVWMLDGSESTLLVHMEFQHQVDPDLPKRLYTYNTRIYSLLQEQVMTVVVLGDADLNWRPAEFGYRLGDSQHGWFIQLPSCSTMSNIGSFLSTAITHLP